MRLDKYLWFIRITKTRPHAAALIEQGRLRINGRLCDKPHSEVRVGMVLSFAHQDRVRILRIEALPERRGPAPEAQSCYTDLSPPALDG